MKLLDNKIILKYDYKKTKINVDNFMNDFYEDYYKYINILPPSITSHLTEIKVESTRSNESSIEKYVEKKAIAEQQLMQQLDLILKVFDTFNKQEEYFFKGVYIKGETEEHISELLNITRQGMGQIRRSAIIKFALALNLEVKKMLIN